jgi:hypothetical protein
MYEFSAQDVFGNVLNITVVYKFQSKNIFQKRKKINASLAWLRVENGIIKLFKSSNPQRHFVSICKSKYCDLIIGPGTTALAYHQK